MRIVAISDTHGMHRQMLHPIPDGDVLVHCGDMTGSEEHSYRTIVDVAQWMETLPHKHKIVVPGNHDLALYASNEGTELTFLFDECGVKCLTDCSAIIEGLHFYGSPWTPSFCGWYFMLERNGRALAQKWREIPDDTQVLVTHGPPKNVLDAYVEPRYIAKAGEAHVGCPLLLNRIVELPKLALHLFGHIHEGYGRHRIRAANGGTVECVNAATCTRGYEPTNPPQVIDL